MNMRLKEIWHDILMKIPGYKSLLNKRFRQTFNECVERLQNGDTIESCLRSYPDLADDLEVLLKTALNVNWRGSMIQPRPEFKAYARSHFIGALRYKAEVHQTGRHPAFFGLQRAWVPALIVVLLFVFSGVGTAAAASNALPDQPLYPVKLATEQIRLAFTFSDEGKAELHTKLSETRSNEIVIMAIQDKPEQITTATKLLSEHLEAAETAIDRVEAHAIEIAPPVIIPPEPTEVPPTKSSSIEEKPKDDSLSTGLQTNPPTEVTETKAEKLRDSLTTAISKNIASFEKAQSKTPEKAQEALEKAINISKLKQDKIKGKPNNPKQEPETPKLNNGTGSKDSPTHTPSSVEPQGTSSKGDRIQPASTKPSGSNGNGKESGKPE